MTQISDRRTTRLAAPSRHLRYLPATTLAVYAAVIAGAMGLAVVGRRRLGLFDTSADVTSSLTIAGPALVACWLVTIALLGGHREDVFGAGTDEYKRVFNASLLTAGLVGIGCYLAKFQLSRGFFVLVFLVGVPALLMGRFLVRGAIHRARRRGHLQHRALLAGSAVHVDEVAAVLRRERWLGYHIAGALVPDCELGEETAGGVPIVGSTEQTVTAIRAADADVVFFAGGALNSASEMRRIGWDLEQADVRLIVAPSVTDISGERIRVRPVGGLPLLHIDPPRATDAARWGKRFFDIVGSACLIALLGPLMALAGARVKLHDRGPVFFKQTRTGRDGRQFSCLKFRTMCVDAEERLPALHAQVGHNAGLFKMKDDPRVTKPGRWLRRYSVDELPQLFNVLRGDMSLVGPRPPLPREVESYHSDMLRRLRVRPGMTGLWQVSGRSDLSWEEAVRLDLYYVDNWSMLQDLTILSRTIGAVFGSRGAY